MAVKTVWEWLEAINMNCGKQRPLVACFQDCMEGGVETMGYYAEGVVYLKEDIATAGHKYLLRTALEEVCHDISGASDASRIFRPSWSKRSSR